MDSIVMIMAAVGFVFILGKVSNYVGEKGLLHVIVEIARAVACFAGFFALLYFIHWMTKQFGFWGPLMVFIGFMVAGWLWVRFAPNKSEKTR